LKSISGYTIRLRLLLIVLCGYLLSQSQARGQATHSADTVATQSAQSKETSGSKPGDGSYVIGNDDILAINVWKEPDFSRSIQVRSDGKISLPLMGEVQATGRTPLQLQQDIATKLQDYITKPEVTVMVEQINSKKFNVLGQVIKPGSYSLTLASTVVDALAIANGPRDFAKLKSIFILRQNSGGGQTRIAFNYRDFLKGKAQNVKLEPNDTVVVP